MYRIITPKISNFIGNSLKLLKYYNKILILTEFILIFIIWV